MPTPTLIVRSVKIRQLLPLRINQTYLNVLQQSNLSFLPIFNPTSTTFSAHFKDKRCSLQLPQVAMPGPTLY